MSKKTSEPTKRTRASKSGARSRQKSKQNQPAGNSETGDTIRRQALDILRKEYPSPAPTAPAPPSPEPKKCDDHTESQTSNPASTPSPSSGPSARRQPAQADPPESPDQTVIPIRMLNEFVYCPRLFYYEFIEGVFVKNADTERGQAVHKRVDRGTGGLPAQPSSKPEGANGESGQAEEGTETIHSYSVQLGSERLGVTAKLDLVETRLESDGSNVAEVCPVDYKAGSPKPGADGNELWDADKIQLALQCLILSDNGYHCREGIIYYRGNKQRVRLPVTPDLENWVIEKIGQARQTMTGPIPAPLVASPKCPRCSLVTVCLPDETQALVEAPVEEGPTQQELFPPEPAPAKPIRRSIAARDDTRALYLSTHGLNVGRSDEVLQVRDRKQTLEQVRISDLTHVALFGNIQLTTQAIQTLCDKDIPISYFSMGGWFYGITRGHSLKNVFLRIEQFRQAALPEVPLQLARLFVHGKIRNHRTLLMRNHLEPPKAAIRRLKMAADDALKARSLEELLGIEGAAAAVYFEHFTGMIKVEQPPDSKSTDAQPEYAAGPSKLFQFDFQGRNRRPPTDPVNALLSLGYSLLAKDCTVAAHAVGFDPYIGFFHQPRFGRPALALDIQEEFRPLIAESTVLTAINNRIITEKDFVRAGRAVNLTPAGRKQLFQAYEQRMNSLVTHPVFDYKVSYRRALELQFRILARVLTGEIPAYIPFTTR